MTKRGKIFWILVAGLILALLISGWLNQNIARRYRFTEDEKLLVNELKALYESKYESPENFLIRFFSEYDIIFLGETPKVANHLLFLNRLLPILYENGIRHIGFQYLLHRDQAEIDRIVTAKEFDTAAAKQLLYHYMVIWGYQEYLQILRTVWALNHDRDEGQPPLRLVGLSPFHDYSYIKTEQDIRDPEILKQVQIEGAVDVFMAQIIQKEFAGQKALIYTDSKHIFTRYTPSDYVESARQSGLTDTRRTGMICRDAGMKLASVMLHSFWPDDEKQMGVALAMNGLLDRLVQLLPRKINHGGIDLRSGTFAQLPITEGIYAKDNSDLQWGDLWDGYLFLGRLSSYHGTTAIPKFINSDNLQYTLDHFPGPKITDEDISPKDLNRFIKRSGDRMNSVIQAF